MIDELIARFAIGTNFEGRTVFWQIDEQGRIRSGKIIAYGTNGKRIKSDDPDKPSVAWVHRRLRLEGFELSQCLFGEHQLSQEPGKNVAIVESEKSAIIASALLPEFVWLATGGKQNLKPEKFKPLKGRQVVLFPDSDAFTEWSEKAQTLRLCCEELAVNDLLETSLTVEEKREGLDIADFLIAERQCCSAPGESTQSELQAEQHAPKLCDHCYSPMQSIEAGCHSCPNCHCQIVQARSGYWTTSIGQELQEAA